MKSILLLVAIALSAVVATADLFEKQEVKFQSQSQPDFTVQQEVAVQSPQQVQPKSGTPTGLFALLIVLIGLFWIAYNVFLRKEKKIMPG